MTKLTETQNRALNYIRTVIESSGVSPTLREICSHMGYSAIGSAQDVIGALRKKGYIEASGKHAARRFVLTDLARSLSKIDNDDPNTFIIPCLGYVPAGNPLEAVEEASSTLRISISMIPRPVPKADELFALQATGESMRDAGILDGDWLVIHAQKDAPKGSVVVARVEEEVTVKRLMQDQSGWFLQPENPDFRPIYAYQSPFELVGRVVALQRAIF